MPAGNVPPAVRRFVGRWIYSIEQLEILCLLSATPAKSWSVSEVFSRIQSSETSISDNLRRFAEGGLLETEPGKRYRYAPKRAEWSKAVAQLATFYRERRVSLIAHIYSKRPMVQTDPSSPADPAPPTQDAGASQR